MISILQILSAILAASLLSLLFIFLEARCIIQARHNSIAELELKLCNTKAQLTRTELWRAQARDKLTRQRYIKVKATALERELEDTKTAIAAANKRHQHEVAKASDLETKAKDDKQRVNMLLTIQNGLTQDLKTTKSALKEKTAELKASSIRIERLSSIKLTNHNQLASYTSQLRTANAEVDALKQNKSHLEARLASEMEYGIELKQQISFKAEELHEMTQRLEEWQRIARQMGSSLNCAWSEVRDWRSDPVGMLKAVVEFEQATGEDVNGMWEEMEMEMDEGHSENGWQMLDEEWSEVVNVE